jgi:hypothetical protein
MALDKIAGPGSFNINNSSTANTVVKNLKAGHVIYRSYSFVSQPLFVVAQWIWSR